MPDGTVVEMPDELTPDMVARLKSLRDEGKHSTEEYAKPKKTGGDAITDARRKGFFDIAKAGHEMLPEFLTSSSKPKDEPQITKDPALAKSKISEALEYIANDPKAPAYLRTTARSAMSAFPEIAATIVQAKDKGISREEQSAAIRESARTIASGIGHSIKGGMQGIGTLVKPSTYREWAEGGQDPLMQASDVVEKAQKETYKPKTQLGKAITGWVGMQGEVPGAQLGAAGGGTVRALGGSESTAQNVEEGLKLAPSLVGGVLGLKGAVKSGLKPAEKIAATPKQEIAKQSVETGYSLPPTSTTKSKIAKGLESWGDSKKTAQQSSEKNQPVTNDLGKKSLGLPEDTHLTGEAYDAVRQEAGKAYEAIKDVKEPMKTDTAFRKSISGIGGARSESARDFANLLKNPEIDALRAELSAQKPFSTTAAIEVVKDLRNKAKSNLKSMGENAESKHALGLAQREAAEQIDLLVERNLTKLGKSDLVDNYRAARKQIAKAHDMESVTNTATGNLSARGLARLADRGVPLDGELKKIARVAKAFPMAVQDLERIGGIADHSQFDLLGGAVSAMHGKPEIAGALLAKPAVRSAILSKPAQKQFIKPGVDTTGRVPYALKEALPAAAAPFLAPKPKEQEEEGIE